MRRVFLLGALICAPLAPAAAVAQGCHHDGQQAQVSCADGHAWDEKAKACVPVSS